MRSLSRIWTGSRGPPRSTRAALVAGLSEEQRAIAVAFKRDDPTGLFQNPEELCVEELQAEPPGGEGVPVGQPPCFARGREN